MSTSVNVKIDEAQAKEMAKKAGAKALELGKKGLSTGKAHMVCQIGPFQLSNQTGYLQLSKLLAGESGGPVAATVLRYHGRVGTPGGAKVHVANG